MKIKGIVPIVGLFVTGVIHAEPNNIVINNEDALAWAEDKSITSEDTVAGIGILADGVTGGITSDSDILISGNNVGLKSFNGADLIITNTGADKTLTFAGDTTAIQVGDVTTKTSSSLKIENMNVDISGTGIASGIYVTSGSDFELSGNIDTGSNLTVRDMGAGKTASGIQVVESGVADIKNMNMNFSGLREGLGVHGGTATLTGMASGANTLSASGNNNGIDSSSAKNLTIKNMNISLLNNTNGLSHGGIVNLEGVADGANKMEISNNINGILFAGATNFNSKYMDIIVNNNTTGVNLGGLWNLEGAASGVNKFEVSDNTGKGFNYAGGQSLDVKYMDIIIENNAGGGLTTFGTFNFQGVASGTNKLVISGNSKDNTPSMLGQSGGFYGGFGAGPGYIKYMDVYLNNNYTTGMAVQTGILNIIGIDSRNKMEASNNTVAAFYANPSVTLNIENMNIVADNNDIFYYGANVNLKNTSIVQNSGDYYLANDTKGYTESPFVFNLTDSQIKMNSSEKLVKVSGGGVPFEIVADNSSILGSVTVDYTGSSQGHYNTGGVVFSLKNNSEWMMKHDSSLKNLSVSNSVVDLTATNRNQFNTLTLVNLDSDNSLFKFSSNGINADRLVIDKSQYNGGMATSGTATGNAQIQVNVWGAGDGSDILLVDFADTSDKSISFDLVGASAGAYGQELVKGDDDNYYLRILTQDGETDALKSFKQVSGNSLIMVKGAMNELNKRLGELRMDVSNGRVHGAWARGFGSKMDVDSGTKMDLFGAEAGYDFKLFADGKESAYAGVMVGNTYTDMEQSSVKGKGNADLYSVGVYGTYLNSGWFTDMTARYFWGNMESSVVSGLDNVNLDMEQRYFAASVEFGKQIKCEFCTREAFLVEPKAELSYVHSDGGRYTTNFGNIADVEDAQSLTAKLGVNFGYRYTADDVVYQPYLELSLKNEFMGKTDIMYDGVAVNGDISGMGYEAAVGMNALIGDASSIYGQVSYENGEAFKAISGNLGLRLKF